MTPQTQPYKAVAAFVITFLGLIAQALVGKGDSVVTPREWFVTIVGALVATAAVYGITNPPRD